MALTKTHNCIISKTETTSRKGQKMTEQRHALSPVESWAQARMPFLSGAENRDTFFRRVAKFLPELDPRYQGICKAYEIAKDAFREIERDGGERYFEHLRAVALILLEYLEIEDYEVVIAALLHDIVEDKPEWDIQRIRNEFGDRVALLVSYLSQPGPDEFCKEDSRCLTMLWSIFESGNE
jgi:hypothetical protein